MPDLIDEIDVLMPSDESDYCILKLGDGPVEIKRTTTEAALVVFSLSDGTTANDWFPKSQLRSDFDDNLYLANWLYEQKVG